jgi:2-dehydro-3-deoxyphosphogalactonate aldolase
MTLDEALNACPLIAILRGVRPDEVLDHAFALAEAGLRAIEIPLNSPDALDSVARLTQALGGDCVCGAGTVLRVSEVEDVAAAGAKLVVSPNMSPAVIARSIQLGMTPVPGVATATECFAAIEAGGRFLKLFPAQTYGPAHLRQLRAVLPAEVAVLAVGGVGRAHMTAWWEAGVSGFGLGSELYRPGQTPADTAEKAARALAAVTAERPR